MSRLSWVSYAALVAAKYTSRSFWTTRTEWVGSVPDDPWQDVRLIAILHHTSLAEPLYLPAVPNRVLRRLARHGVAPIADETMARPVAGRIFRLLVAHPVAVTRKRDHSWAEVLDGIHDPEAMVALCPEGRMMRTTGRDKNGAPMTVKRGIADVLPALGHGRMVLAYSGGLHHVFPPGAVAPRPFRRIRVRIESVDIAEYIAARAREPLPFVDAVVHDLTRRRDLHTPVAPGTPAAVTAEVARRRRTAWFATRDAAPTPTPTPTPARAPARAPDPQPAIQPLPEPRAQPESRPLPQPAPEPAPQPAIELVGS
jgi:hypothetical protein